MFENLRGRRAGYIDEQNLRRFAVMVPLLKKEDGIHVVFEQRSGRLNRQPGEICFPGGARDGEETPLENAVRETAEELCIGRDQIDVIAQMDTMLTAYSNEVSVFLCELKGYEMTFSGAEVSRIFTVPLHFFMENPPQAYPVAIKEEPMEGFPFDRIPGGRGYYWRQGRRNVYFYQYGSDTIWGLTAYILHSVVGIMQKEAEASSGSGRQLS